MSIGSRPDAAPRAQETARLPSSNHIAVWLREANSSKCPLSTPRRLQREVTVCSHQHRHKKSSYRLAVQASLCKGLPSQDRNAGRSTTYIWTRKSFYYCTQSSLNCSPPLLIANPCLFACDLPLPPPPASAQEHVFLSRIALERGLSQHTPAYQKIPISATRPALRPNIQDLRTLPTPSSQAASALWRPNTTRETNSVELLPPLLIACFHPVSIAPELSSSSPLPPPAQSHSSPATIQHLASLSATHNGALLRTFQEHIGLGPSRKILVAAREKWFCAWRFRFETLLLQLAHIA
ncbi:hypothetical protein BS50DRAFT_634609 [Corynespora cassiicola Philippines]|uniref:Uncharacterized protein n=1 Tax=Corynespora cassiicola Philippines TaxID=1448308 RepID=A0A2T2NP42_CORCC|nr:hypothetical protein BS50DRAFT_634609 [Corynespora cassiicola Philippines]